MWLKGNAAGVYLAKRLMIPAQVQHKMTVAKTAAPTMASVFMARACAAVSQGGQY